MAETSLWPADAFALLSDMPDAYAPPRLFAHPLGAVEAWRIDDVAPALDALDAARARGLHAVGFLAYELGLALEPHLHPLLPSSRDVPLLSFGLFETPRELNAQEFAELLTGDARLDAMTPDWTPDAYGARFDDVRALIAAGDVYQINLTFPMRGRLEGAAGALFGILQQRAGARYGALLALKDRHILSLSPELFIESDGQTLHARPMKGTSPRAARPQDDAALAAALARDEKTRAENMMIVDLLRNDLARVATTGGVRVTSLFDIETYPTLHQMTSSIEAQLAPGVTLHETLKAVFPCGSVTGAPKIRAMEIIHALEDTPRGVYCGAVGHLGPGGALRLNVAIRTLTVMGNGDATFGIGSGLVYDSDVQAEYAECLLKARILDARDARPALFETLRLEQQNGYIHRALHLERLSASAHRLDYPCNIDALDAALDTAARTSRIPLARVRLVLADDGVITTDVRPFDDTRDGPLRLMLSPHPVSSTDPLLYHKTTARDFYDGERARLAGRGCEEVLFVNERGALTEGSFTNLFVQRDGVLLTPAVACGLLPGVLRRHLIDTGTAREAVLTPRDLENAEALYVGNALRGLVPARYCGPAL